MDWRDIAGKLAQAGAPIIGGALGGPIGGLIGSAIGNVVADALGVEPTPEAVDKAIATTPPEVLVAKLSAAEAEAQAKWPALAEMVKAQEEGRTERFKTGAKDNADARDMQVELVKTGSPIQWAPMIVSIIILAGYFAVLYLLFTRPFAKLDDNFKDILIFMLGALQVGVGQVVNYWLGSSAGSAAKDSAMRDITATSVVAAATSTPAAPTKAPVKR
jgi:hypothetical protein